MWYAAEQRKGELEKCDRFWVEWEKVGYHCKLWRAGKLGTRAEQGTREDGGDCSLIGLSDSTGPVTHEQRVS